LFGEAKFKKLESKEITSVPATVKKILFLGGEPLLTDRHLKLLEKHPKPQTCDIVYNTNCSIIPSIECIESWKKFRSVGFIASLDGYGKVNEQVREGSNWSECVEFLDWCTANNYPFEVNTVLHKNNWHSLEDLADFVKNYTQEWYVNVLTFPPELDIINLEYKDKVKLHSIVDSYSIPNSDFIKNHLKLANRQT
jgi:sulfatase maturation enzyme AslB (radical SAM superfamily)